MPRTKDAPQTVESPKTLPAWETPAVVPDPDGYYGDADWLRIECDWEGLQPREGFAPLWAEIDCSLTFAEAMAIPLEKGTPMARIFPHLTGRVRAWNVRERDAESGNMVPVPPPAEIGAEAFQHVRPVVTEWLATMLKIVNLGGGPNRKNETTPSDAGSSGPNADD